MSPVGDTARAFHKLAAAAGIQLKPGVAPMGLTNRGHAEPALANALPREAFEALQGMFLALDGDKNALAAKGPRSLQPDFCLADSGQLVELDESQHFTSARLRTLRMYPNLTEHGTEGGFDLAEYTSLCERHAPTSDKDFAHKEAAEFPGRHGRQRQRAYLDAVRDLGAPALGTGPVIRIPAPDRLAGPAAERLRELVSQRRT